MNDLNELKRKTILGQELLDRTKERLTQLQRELDRERQQRLLDEEATAAAKAQDRILQEISKSCVPASANHLLILLKSQGLLEVEGDSIFVKTTDRYNQPASIPLETGLPKLIQERFPHFFGSGEQAIAPSKQVDATMPSQSSSREKLETMSDQELLSLVSNPEKMTKLVNDF
jgi:exonuclease VII large subunit